jgi:hopanoid-associated phosphorylase
VNRRFVVAVSGLAIEARIARVAAVRTVVAGSAARLADELASEIRSGAAAVISFGIAGGLAADLRAGTCIVGRHVIGRHATFTADAAWRDAIAARVSDARIGDVVGSDAIVSDPSAKRALHARTHASAVDTESHVAARVAQAHRVPFAVFRVVCDTSSRALPPAANVGLASDRRIDGLAVLRSVATRPTQIARLTRTAVDAAVALRALSRARHRLGAGLAYPDLGELLVDVA